MIRGGVADRWSHCDGETVRTISTGGLAEWQYEEPTKRSSEGKPGSRSRTYGGKRSYLGPPADDPSEPLTAEEALEMLWRR